MEDIFEIHGNLIPLQTIKEFSKVSRDYIYRPRFWQSSSKVFRSSQYFFDGMEPYAAIIDESDRKSTLKAYQAKNFGEALGQDIADFASGVASTIGDKFNIKFLKHHKLLCINTSGRIFTTYLEDVPSFLTRADGQESLVYKYDELYKELGKSTAPAIKAVPALRIVAKTTYLFYGADIQIDVDLEFERLKRELSEYQARKKNKPVLPVFQNPIQINLNLPKSPVRMKIPKTNKAPKVIEAEYAEIEEEPAVNLDVFDVNNDGVIDEKDFEMIQKMADKAKK